MLLHRKYTKNQKIATQEWRDFENHTAWWEKEQPLAPLPQELQTLLDNDDPAFIEQLMVFAIYLESSFVWSENSKQYVWVNNMDFLRRERSWLWSLYLQEKPLARKGFKKLLEYISYQEFNQLKSKSKLNLYHRMYDQYASGQSYYNFMGKYYFRYLKAIYKLAEKKQDIPIWSMLTYRFEVEHHFYNPLIHASTNQTPTMSLKPKTRSYLTRRSWRTLRTLGKQSSADYVHMATELLLKYSPKDARSITVLDQGTNQKQYVPSYTQLWLFNHILYHHSTRFSYGSSTWLAREGAYVAELPERREEAFPALWDQHPEQLLHLLIQADAPLVIHFAGRALRLGNPRFVAKLSDELLEELLRSSKLLQRDFAVREFLNRLDNRVPDLNRWFDFFISPHADVRKLALDYLHTNYPQWSKETKLQLIQRCLSAMEKALPTEVIHDWFPVFKTVFHELLPEVVNLSSLRPLLSNPDPSTQQCLVLLLSSVDIQLHPYTASQLLPFLQNDQEPVRQIARHMLHEHFTKLICTPSFLFQLVMIPYEENQVFVTQFFADRMLWLVPFLPELIDRLWSQLSKPDCPEIVRTYIQHDLLGALFLSELTETPLENVLMLLENDDTSLQELGARILETMQLDPKTLQLNQLLPLAHNQIALARKVARNLLIRVIDRVSEAWLIHLVETDWDDTRNWVFSYMRTLSVEQFTPTLIYGLLDSAREDVQAFAMQLVEIHFRDLDIGELLLRASESTDLFVQEYALSLAEKITWDATKVAKLELFFRTILFRVHQARKAKDMVLSLLTKLGKRNKSMAEVIIPILTDVAHAGGKRDFERILLTLTQIQARYPNIQTPVQLK
jgi:hypothetical protein